MRTAMDDAVSCVECQAFDSVVYIGDAVWDTRACRKLNIPFIGIAEGHDAENLRARGACAVFPDYDDLDAFLAAIEIVGIAA